MDLSDQKTIPKLPTNYYGTTNTTTTTTTTAVKETCLEMLAEPRGAFLHQTKKRQDDQTVVQRQPSCRAADWETFAVYHHLSVTKTDSKLIRHTDMKVSQMHSC